MAAVALGSTPLVSLVYTRPPSIDFFVQYRPILTTFFDNFNRADAGPPNGLGPNWYKRIPTGGSATIESGKAHPTNVGDDSVFGYINDMTSNNFYVEALCSAQCAPYPNELGFGAWSALNLRHKAPWRNEIELVLEPNSNISMKEHSTTLPNVEYCIAEVEGYVSEQVYRLRLEVEGNVATGFIDNVQRMQGPTINGDGRGVGLGWLIPQAGTPNKCTTEDWQCGVIPPWQMWNDPVSSITGAVITGLVPGTRYQFRAAPVGVVEGQVSWSDVVIATAT